MANVAFVTAASDCSGSEVRCPNRTTFSCAEWALQSILRERYRNRSPLAAVRCAMDPRLIMVELPGVAAC